MNERKRGGEMKEGNIREKERQINKRENVRLRNEERKWKRHE